VSREEFTEDMLRAYRKMASHGIVRTAAPYFIPPYEYYNAEVASWARSMGLQVVNFTSGTGTNADYTTPDMASYRSSREILDRLFEYESRSSLNGHILLVHFGTDPARTDKFYDRLDYVIRRLEKLGYRFRRIDEAVSEKSIIFEPITL
jgi:peptidoglycan/xylan/chitin deacetylase (PgdA/CDA1 family)